MKTVWLSVLFYDRWGHTIRAGKVLLTHRNRRKENRDVYDQADDAAPVVEQRQVDTATHSLLVCCKLHPEVVERLTASKRDDGTRNAMSNDEAEDEVP